jgi:hypothetical protein
MYGQIKDTKGVTLNDSCELETRKLRGVSEGIRDACNKKKSRRLLICYANQVLDSLLVAPPIENN